MTEENKPTLEAMAECVKASLETPDALEEWLTVHATEYVGRPGSASTCPIHQFLMAKCEGIEKLYVNRGVCTLADKEENNRTTTINPLWAKHFIDFVDRRDVKRVKGSTCLKVLAEAKEKASGDESKG